MYTCHGNILCTNQNKDPRLHQILYTSISCNIKPINKKNYKITTTLIHIYNWFKFFSSKNDLTVEAKKTSYACPKIGQNWPPKSITSHMEHVATIRGSIVLLGTGDTLNMKESRCF